MGRLMLAGQYDIEDKVLESSSEMRVCCWSRLFGYKSGIVIILCPWPLLCVCKF